MNIEKTVDDLLRKELEEIVKDLQKKHIELGQKASGQWLDTIEIHVQSGRGVILAQDYTKYLTKGRKAGKRPPINPLEDWVNNKLGITGKDARSVAFAIAFKIGKEGTEIHKQGGTDLVDGVITDERIKTMIANIGRGLQGVIKEEIQRNLVA